MATGATVKEEAPPLYQSPQFQNEFPSLDGQPVNAATMNKAGYPNSTELGEKMNLRPQTDAQSWLAQQNAGAARGVAPEGGPGYQTDQDLHAGSQKFIALMPSFMLRGQGPMAPPQHNAGPPQQQSNAREGSAAGNYHGREPQHHSQNNGNYQGRQRQERGGERYQGQQYNDQYGRRPAPRHQNRNDERGQSYEQVQIHSFLVV